jgi:hypothetical protein
MQHRTYEWLARSGYAAHGCVYVIMGGLAVLAALGAGGQTMGQGGPRCAAVATFRFCFAGSGRLWPALLLGLENCAIDPRRGSARE